MSSLFGKSVASTYKDLLQISNNNIGVDDVVRYIEDGEGTPSALGISSNMIGISGHVIPQDNELYDLGDAEHKFRHLYLSDSTIYIGDTTFNVADIEAVKEIQTAATIPLSTVIESAESALQSGEVSLLDLTDEFQTEYGALKDTAASAVQPNTTPVFEDVQVTGSINGPAIMRIDPAAVGDNTGKVVIAGDLQVDGDTTTVNSTTISTSSSVITLAQGATNAAQADGAGVVVDGADATLKYSSTTDTWTSNKSLDVPSIKQLVVDQTSTFTGGATFNNITSFNSDVSIGGAFNFKTNGSVGGEQPAFGQAIVWNGAKWIPGTVATGGGGGAAGEVPAPYRIALPAGQSTYTINFQQTYENIPAVATDLEIAGDLPIIPYAITDVTTSNFTIEFAETLTAIGYYIHVTFGGRDVIWQKDQLGQVYYDAGPVSMDGSLTVGGNLTVQGNSSIINTNELNIKDHNIIIASGTASQDLSGVVLGDAGITWGDDDTVKLGYDSRYGFGFQGGDVGIGTTNPGAALHVDSSLDGPIFDSGGTGNTNHALLVRDSAKNQLLRVNNNGNVGIGTTSPGGLLHVAPKNNEDANGDPTNESYFKVFDNDISGLAQGRNGGVAVIDANYYLPTSDIFTVKGRGDSKLAIKGNGKVGIGTDSPSGKLHVVANETYADPYNYRVYPAVKIKNDARLEPTVLSMQGANSDGSNMYGNIIWNSLEAQNTSYFAINANIRDANHLVIKGNGNVGIGTTSPSEILVIQDSSNPRLQIRDGDPGSATARTAGTLHLGEDTTLGVAIENYTHNYNDNCSMVFKTTPAAGTITERMRIDPAGNVGIGATVPTSRLHIANVEADTRAFRISRVEDENISLLDIFQDSSWEDANGIGQGSGIAHVNTNNRNLAITTSVDQSLDGGIFINVDGNVGIGTASPGSKLEVNSGAIITTADQGIGGLRFQNGSSSNLNFALIDGRTDVEGSTDYTNKVGLAIYTQAAERMRISSGGNVGIGTAMPARALEVVGDTSGKIMRLTPSTGKHVELNTGTTNFIIAVNDSSSNALTIRHDTSGVGIGQNNTAAINTNERLWVNGKVRADSGVLTSDDRVKHNEQPIVGALETLSKITPKKYIKTYEIYDADHNFELDGDGNPIDVDGAAVNHHIEAGVIAQQVLTVDELAFAVSPEGVDEDGTVTSPHGLDYNSLFTYAIAAIQEQQQLIDELKTQNQQLISRIETLENK